MNPDYDFLDPRLEVFFRQVNEALNVTGWIHGLRALSPQLKFAWSEVAVMKRLTPWLPGLENYFEKLRGITRTSNAVLFEVVEELVERCRRESESASISKTTLAQTCRGFVEELMRERDAFVLMNQAELLRVLEPEPQALSAYSFAVAASN